MKYTIEVEHTFFDEQFKIIINKNIVNSGEIIALIINDIAWPLSSETMVDKLDENGNVIGSEWAKSTMPKKFMVTGNGEKEYFDTMKECIEHIEKTRNIKLPHNFLA